MSAHSGIFSFPFRIYASEQPDGLEVSHEDGRHRIRVYSPWTVRPSGMPLSPDAPFGTWPGFDWNPGLDRSKRLPPPSEASARPGGETFFDAIRIDVRGPESEILLGIFVDDFLGWLRQISLQSWIGAYEPHSDLIKKYGFRCDGEGRAIDTPYAYMKAMTFSEWMHLVTEERWELAVECASGGQSPPAYWDLFLDAHLARAEGKVARSLLLMALALEVARDSNFPRFASTVTKAGVGEVLEDPFDDTDLLAHLSSRVEEAHPDDRNLETEHPDVWTAVRRVYVARHHIAHGKPAVILDNGGVRPATDEDVRDLGGPIRDALLWVENL